jgi:hypothetical protein
MADHLPQGSPTNFRREDITLGTDVDGCVLLSLLFASCMFSARQEAKRTDNAWHRNAMLVEQAREDALEMHKASKIEGLRKHARKISARFGGSGKHVFEGDLH